ncbi:hypothetical protein Tco_0015101 [Tanacetum coccineum]
MTDHVANLDKENQTNKMENESLTAELERYKERVVIFEQRQNVDLNKREPLIDSQMDDLIQNRNAKFAAFQQEINTLKETISNQEHDVIYVIDDEETLILEEDKQAFWLKYSNYNPDTSVKSHTPVRIEAPSELPKVSLVNESRKKLKYQLASFDKVVKKRTTSDAITAEIVHIAVNSVDILYGNKSCVDECNKYPELETKILKKKDLIEKDV